MAEVIYELGAPVDDPELSALHHGAFGHPSNAVDPWDERLAAHSLTWVQARRGARLVGFVNVAWDGGTHAFVLDTVVHATLRHQGIGVQLVRRAADAARAAGCEWLHVDFEPHLADFYATCGFTPSTAGVLRLVG